MAELLLNPPAATLGRSNAVLTGRARRYEAHFAGPLSLKTVVSGRAVWETEAGRFEVTPGCALVLNDGEEYAMTIDALQPVETFCVFFERGFVEDAYRAATRSSADLLDRSEPIALHFHERWLSADFGAMSPRRIDVHALAQQLARTQCDADARVAKLPALRASTREELLRRVERGVEYLHAHHTAPVRLADVAAAAALSQFHFHRLFTAMLGVTPHRYLTRLRIERARSILSSSQAPISDVAFDCGFESLGSFTSLFARETGLPPGRFRKIEEARRAGRK